MLVISGQVKRETCMRVQGITGLRQLGDQEADTIAMVAGITKYAVLVERSVVDPLSPRARLASRTNGASRPLLARRPSRCTGCAD